jgi:hypothetical protein
MSQGLIFSEPSIAETGVWCQLRNSIDPADWAFLCRYLGNLSPGNFYKILSTFKSQSKPSNIESEPLVSVGPSGIHGDYQNQWNGELL